MIDYATLRAEPALGGYTDADVATFAEVGRAASYRSGAVFAQQLTPARSCFLVLRGAVDRVRAVQKKLFVVGTEHPGTLVGFAELVDGKIREENLAASGDTVVLELGSDVFARLMTATTPLGLRFQQHVATSAAAMLRGATERLTVLSDQRADVYEKLQGDVKDGPGGDLDAIEGDPGLLFELAFDPRSRR